MVRAALADPVVLRGHLPSRPTVVSLCKWAMAKPPTMPSRVGANDYMHLFGLVSLGLQCGSDGGSPPIPGSRRATADVCLSMPGKARPPSAFFMERMPAEDVGPQISLDPGWRREHDGNLPSEAFSGIIPRLPMPSNGKLLPATGVSPPHGRFSTIFPRSGWNDTRSSCCSRRQRRVFNIAAEYRGRPPRDMER